MEVLAKQWVDRCENKRPDVALFPAYKDKGFIFDVFFGKSTRTLYPILIFGWVSMFSTTINRINAKQIASVLGR